MSIVKNKFHLKCRSCGTIINDFPEWFGYSQKCPDCGNKWVDVEYSKDYSHIKELIKTNDNVESIFHYFDFLPINNKENIVTRGEGVIPVENWCFLEDYAKKYYNLNLKVNVYRNDLNPGTGTFKDVAASVAASVLKEAGIKQYVVASTGNIASAFAHYFALAGITLSVFIPSDALVANEAEISSYGQRVYRVNGDYAKAKKIAAEYSEKYNIIMSGGNIDPLRVEAKKTMVWEWLRQTGEMADVYIQALSGGTGPIAIAKGIKEIKSLGIVDIIPRFILIQPDRCDPMTAGWNKAKDDDFPDGWETKYPIYENPVTLIPTLATGNPGMFPIISKLVKESDGEIISFAEEDAIKIARIVAFEKGIKIGPASTIAVGGFFESLKKGLLRDGESVLINVGESMNRAPEFVKEMIYTTIEINSIDDCIASYRDNFKESLWSDFIPDRHVK